MAGKGRTEHGMLLWIGHIGCKSLVCLFYDFLKGGDNSLGLAAIVV